jgi:F-type H+-transporting ATPase subunit b
MLIDWFTDAAQAVNFLILVWLLKHFLYQPVLAAIDAREQQIAATIKSAAGQEAKAHAAGEELHKRTVAFDAERDGLMRKATDDGAAERQRLIEAARQESDLLRAKLGQSLSADRAELGRQLSLRTQSEVFALTRKALSELAGASLEDRMVEVLIDRLRDLPEPDKLALAGARADAAVLVRSAYDLAPGGRSKLEAALRERVHADTAVRFATAPELVCGLELSLDGVKLPWSVSDYLATLAHDTAALAATAMAAPAHAH